MKRVMKGVHMRREDALFTWDNMVGDPWYSYRHRMYIVGRPTAGALRHYLYGLGYTFSSRPVKR